jgi:hypothetical protein
MIRQWFKILVLVIALLSQIAMTCSRDEAQQGSASPDPRSTPPPPRSSY